MNIQNILIELQKYQWETRDEKLMQEQLFKVFLQKFGFIREYYLDSKNIVDFFHPESGIIIECKTQGTPMNIFRQLKRYSVFSNVKEIILVSAKTMALPKEIEGKPATAFIINKNWL